MHKEDHPEKASVVIPCFNEAKTIGSLVRAITASPHVGEIIVVDDASSDATARMAQAAGAAVHSFDRNQGKGGAMHWGVMHAHYPVILFVDGDMDGISLNVIRDVITPVSSGVYDMFIGIRKRNSILLNTAIRFLPMLSGLRAIKKSFWEEIPKQYRTGYGIETVLNYFCRYTNRKVGYSVFSEVRHKIKEDKYGFLMGARRRLVMHRQLCAIYWRLYFLHQFDNLQRRAVRKILAVWNQLSDAP